MAFLHIVSSAEMRRAMRALVLLAAAGLLQVELPAAPAFEGFGAVTSGAASSPDGYTVFHVTSLADSGPGSLRDAVSQGKRQIVFDVAGTITLASDLNLYYSYVTLDGSTAPAPGITIRQPNSLNTTIWGQTGGVHDVVVQHLRVDGMAGGVHTNRGDIFGLDGQDGPVYNIVIDHVTGIAASDGVFDLWGRVYNVTISWNLITDTVTALHFSRPEDVRENVSIHHNVFARNNERQIRIKYDSRLDFVNNIVWGWSWMGGGRGLDIDTTYSVDPTLNVVNNYYYRSNGSGDDAVVYSGGTGAARVYMSGNIVPTGERDASGTTSTPMPVPEAARVTTHPASSLGTVVAPCVGMKYRNPQEQTLLDEIARALGGNPAACPATPTPTPPRSPTNVRVIRS